MRNQAKTAHVTSHIEKDAVSGCLVRHLCFIREIDILTRVIRYGCLKVFLKHTVQRDDSMHLPAVFKRMMHPCIERLQVEGLENGLEADKEHPFAIDPEPAIPLEGIVDENLSS